MKKIFKLSLIFLLTANVYSCLAWGKAGHEMVATVAKQYVTSSVLEKVNKYLGNMTWQDAATWMDEQRSDKTYDYMKPWHYVNVEKGKTYIKNSDENIVNALEKKILELSDRSKLSEDVVSLDIKIIFHLVGDLHQPLHVGYGIDKGGNTIKVNFYGKSYNLHQVWDYLLIEKRVSFADDIKKLEKKLSAEEIANLQKVDIVAWMNDGRAYLPQIYSFGVNGIGKKYVKKNSQVVDIQIIRAGIRLAGLLNEIFGKD